MELEWEQDAPRDNLIAGTVGAFWGSLIGVACIVLVSRLGYVAGISGAVMAVCAIKGYAILGGQFSKRGAVISGVMILVMTYIGNRVNFTLALMDTVTDEGISLSHQYGGAFFTLYQNIGQLLADSGMSRLYWGELALLYLFTLLGGVPVLLGSLRETAGERTARPETAAGQAEPPPIQGEFSALSKDWTKPLRLSVFTPILAIVAAMVGGILASMYFQKTRLMAAITFGGLTGMVYALCAALSTLQLCNNFHILYVRAGGKLWCVDLQRFCFIVDWGKQPENRKDAIKRDILSEISRLLDGEAPRCGPGALTELKDIQIEKEDPWSWTCSYELTGIGRRKLRISKGYPRFCPVSGAERPQGPVPARWTVALISLCLTAGLIGLFWAADLPISVSTSGSGSRTLEAASEPEPDTERIPARVPENIMEYEMSEVWFRLDGSFRQSKRTFLDSSTGTLYRAYVQYGVDYNGAWDTLSQYISKYHISPLYDSFDAVYLDESPLAPLDEASRYNIVSVYLTDGRAFHTAAVLSEDGALFTIEAEQTASGESGEILANLMYTLESVRFVRPEVTEETYQSRIHVSKARNCTYMAAAYLKTDIFGYDSFVDV